MTTFTYRGHEYEYETGPYNDAALNERTVEVPIGRAFIPALIEARGLEVGNVLSHYGCSPVWRVVDRYEGPEHLDVFRIDGSYPWIVAVSTLEHVRWDPPEPRRFHGAEAALDHLLTLLAPEGRMLVTVPFGQHRYLDAAILDHRWTPEHECSMVRDGDGWVETAVEWRACDPVKRWANSVWIAEFAA